MIDATTSGRIVIVGAGGFGREVLDVVEAINAAGGSLQFAGYVDDGEVNHELLARRRAPFLGTRQSLTRADAAYVIGIGSGSRRAKLAATFDEWRLDPATLVHPAATIWR